MAFVLSSSVQLTDKKSFLDVAGDHNIRVQDRYPAADSRVANTWTTAPKTKQTEKVNKQTLTGIKADNGGIYYLPYGVGKITSMRLSGTNPAAKLFLTANLSGCRFFIDRVAGSTDIVVSHANVRNPTPEPEINHQNEETSRALEKLHTDMIAGYAPTILTNVKTLTKQIYYQAAKDEEDRKKKQGKKNVEFWGGAALAGFYVGNSWQFYYQTFGGVTHDKRPIGDMVFDVYDAKRFWPY